MTDRESKIYKASNFEREGNRLLAEKKVDEAFRAFDQAGQIYKDLNEPLKAAICFASAATCWNIHTGWQPLRSAATRTEMAAWEALKAKYFSYARELFREATLLYEREGDYDNYSECFMAGQDTHVRHLFAIFLSGKTKEGLDPIGHPVSIWERIRAAGHGFMGVLGWALWGYGERPLRTVVSMLLIVLACAAAFQFSGLIQIGGALRPMSFEEAFYYSAVTFATVSVGFGEFAPFGWTRMLTIAEAFSSLMLVSLFLIALTRRYLRLSQG